MKFCHRRTGVFIFAIFFALSPLLAEASGPSSGDIVAEINSERTSRGLNAVRANSALTQAAQSRAQVLAQLGQLVHVSAPHGTPWPELSQVGYTYTLAGENLALGIETASELRSKWMASQAHRANILEAEFEDIGIGIATGNYQGMKVSYVVSFYGKKKTGGAQASISQAAPVPSFVSRPSVSTLPLNPVEEIVPLERSEIKAPKKVEKPLVKTIPAKAPVEDVKELTLVLSNRYTLDTLTPVTPETSLASPTRGEGGKHFAREITDLLHSYLRTFLMLMGKR